MECMEGGELFERVETHGKFTEKDASEAVEQMLMALNYLHGHGIVHRDIKLENFMYENKDSSALKLIDFGFSEIWSLSDPMMKKSVGTLDYAAPEVITKYYSNKCDMW